MLTPRTLRRARTPAASRAMSGVSHSGCVVKLWLMSRAATPPGVVLRAMAARGATVKWPRFCGCVGKLLCVEVCAGRDTTRIATPHAAGTAGAAAAIA